MFWLRNKKNNFLLHTLIWGPGHQRISQRAIQTSLEKLQLLLEGGPYHSISKETYTRGDQRVRGKKLPFQHRLINRAGITAHNTATHMQLICYNMLDVSPLRALQLSSRQRYIARTGPFYVAF